MSSISLSYVKYQISGIIFFMIFSKKTSVTWRTQRIDLKKLPLHKWELLWICGFCQFSFDQLEQWIDQSLLCKKDKIIKYLFPPQIGQSILWRDGHYFVTWRTLWMRWLKITQKDSQIWFFILKLILLHLFSLICGSEVLKCFQ